MTRFEPYLETGKRSVHVYKYPYCHDTEGMSGNTPYFKTFHAGADPQWKD